MVIHAARGKTISDAFFAPSHDMTPSDKVYDFVLTKIKSREWTPNDKIMTESELCQKLEVSRVAVREALERLSALGLLVKRQGAGTFVAEPMAANSFNSLIPLILINEQEMFSFLEFRKHFECGNVRLFVEHHTPEDIGALEKNYEDMLTNRFKNPDVSGELDVEFHQLIARGTHNIFVVKTSQIIKEVMGAHQAVLFTKVDSTNAIENHLEILNNIKRGNTEIAALFMMRHIELSIENYRQRLDLFKHRGADESDS